MGKPFWEIVNSVISKSDIILEVLDARFPYETRNEEIEAKVRKSQKTILYIFNKCDLVEKRELEKLKLKPSVFISATKHLGTSILMKSLARLAAKKKVVIGVVGYPNTGKSSVINALKGRSSASSSPQSGHTKGEQLIKISKNIYLIDTPGVLPYKEKDEVKHSLIGSLDFSRVKDPEDTVLKIIQKYSRAIEKHYGVRHDAPEEVLENIAVKKNNLKKGGKPDIKTTATAILRDIQRGKLTLGARP
ncbi:MAG: GTPase [Candidatus Woesearchaeota archaeon]